MNKTISLNHNIIIFGIPLMIMFSMILLTRSSWFLLHPETLSIGVTFDLILTAPLVYILLIRKKKIPKTTAVPFFIAGIIIAGFIVPKDQQFYLNQIKTWILPAVETTILFTVVYKVRIAMKHYKIQRSLTVDFYSALRNATADILPKILSPILTAEIATIYYGLFHWKSRKLNDNEFSYHKESGTVALLFTLMFLIPIETVVIHLLVQLWSHTAAWVLSILSFYSAVQILGIARSMSKRPITVENGLLTLRYGILNESTIKLEDIDSIELSSKSIDPNDATQKISPFSGFEGHNVLLNLKNSNTLQGLWGVKKPYKIIALHIDEKERFLQKINDSLQQLN